MCLLQVSCSVKSIAKFGGGKLQEPYALVSHSTRDESKNENSHNAILSSQKDVPFEGEFLSEVIFSKLWWEYSEIGCPSFIMHCTIVSHSVPQ